MSFRAVFVVLAFGLGGVSLWADQIVMKNGDRVTGSIVKKDGTAVRGSLATMDGKVVVAARGMRRRLRSLLR